MDGVEDKSFKFQLQNMRFRIRRIPSADLCVGVGFQLRLHLDLEFLKSVTFKGRLTAFCELDLLSKAKDLWREEINSQNIFFIKGICTCVDMRAYQLQQMKLQ